MRAAQAKRAGMAASDEGYMLVALIVMTFLILLALSVAAPRMAMQLKREREVETAHRAQQYVRAIQLYYRRFGRYPTSIDALKNTNKIRFLRQEYTDPLTGQADWRLIRQGEAKTTVKGFFGEDLPMMGGPTTGLGAGGATGGGGGLNGTNSVFGSSGGTSTASGSGTGTNATGTTGTGSTGSSTNSSSSGSSGFGSDGVGPIVGVGVGKSGQAILTVNEQTNYEDWEFLYDPRVDALKAKVPITGGGVGSGSGFGSGSGTSANPTGLGNGSGNSGTSTGSPGSTGTGSGSGAGAGSGTGSGTTPQ